MLEQFQGTLIRLTCVDSHALIPLLHSHVLLPLVYVELVAVQIVVLKASNLKEMTIGYIDQCWVDACIGDFRKSMPL